MDLNLSGLASGFDWLTLVDQLTDLERIPQTRLRAEQDELGQKNNAYGSISTQLNVLQNRVDDLMDPDLFDATKVTVDDETIGSASTVAGAALGTYNFNISQLATTASLTGTTDIGDSLNGTNDVSGLVLSDAAFSTAITAGSFHVNGSQVDIETSDTLQDVFDKINTATSGAVTGSYDSATDKITLSSGGEIVLGSAVDTSNFLQVAKLYNNGTGTVASDAQLGSVQTAATLANSNFSTTVSDGGSGAGEFLINGVSFSFDVDNDSLESLMDDINGSAAGVSATYDSSQDRMVLTNKTTGDMGISMQDVTGNFLAASGLSGGTLNRGKNLEYTVNGGAQLTSLSNKITEASSGIRGLTVEALDEGAVSAVVGSDTSKIKDAITGFVSEYNKTQSLIDSQTASSTDADGTVDAGILASERDAAEISTSLRSTVYSEISGLAAAFNHIADLGYDSSGFDDSLTLSDSTALDDALANNIASVKSLFTDETNGLATRLDAYLDRTIGDEGTLIAKQDNLTKQVTDIDDQIADSERLVQLNRERLISSFVSMEQAQSNINQQLQFLQSRFG